VLEGSSQAANSSIGRGYDVAQQNARSRHEPDVTKRLARLAPDTEARGLQVILVSDYGDAKFRLSEQV
jgi:hypothetical protein